MASVSAGDVVAEKYRVERLLGRGGMGYVVAARHLTLDQLVAIKFLRKSALSDEGAVARFRLEAKACVRLRNEHVAKVFDVGVHGEEPFIVMEHLEGADLGVRTKDGRAVPMPNACDYIIQACEGLAEAHALGIIHRDIKLANLFLTRTAVGEPLLKVLDFGVSKSLTAELDAVDVTQTSAVLGSPKYMSPEQMNDPRNVDWRTDVWSLGVCLYRLISGRPPFDGDTIGRVCTMVLHEMPVPLSGLRQDIPGALEAVVDCCMQKDRSFRFANVAELAAALVPFASEPDRAAECTSHIASVLGIPVPPVGYLPPQLAHFQTSQALESAAAWAHTMVAGRKARHRSELRLLVAGTALLACSVVGVALFAPGPGARHALAATPVQQPAVTEPTPESALMAAAVPLVNAPPPQVVNPQPLPAPPSPQTKAAASVPPTIGAPPRRVHGRPTTKLSKTRDDDPRPEGGPASIPGDRK
jgi:tRNA A-37 threonylcarbamoyl transferase component Bud32